MVKSKRVGNVIYSYDGEEFSIMLVDGNDDTKRVHLSSSSADRKGLSISAVEFTQSLLEEANAVLEELSYVEIIR
ncbi:hypothetical protein ACFLU6_02650 [Acidobacteriota bacterium]